MNEPGLYRESANARELQELKTAFDKSNNVNISQYTNNVHTVAGLVKSYFRDLDNPIFLPHTFITWKQSAGLLFLLLFYFLFLFLFFILLNKLLIIIFIFYFLLFLYKYIKIIYSIL